MENYHRVTIRTPINIAVIKYWGKKDEALVLPLNDSLSITLDHTYLSSTTTVMVHPDFEKDRFWLNGKEESTGTERMQSCLTEIRKRATKNTSCKAHICSQNNFPTAAGLASSASGLAGFVKALAEAYGVTGDLTTIARMGSGSACRSLYGGFVRWHKGEKPDGSDSLATQVEPFSHWPTLRILILVVSDKRKKVGSTPGMKLSVKTSQFLQHRITEVVPQRIEEITTAIKAHDFQKFAELTMKDSNNMHSVCLDTFPPLTYMNDVSHKIVEFVHAYNERVGHFKVAYTFDAGPNAVLFMEEEDSPVIVSLLQHVFPPLDDKDYIRGVKHPEVPITQDLLSAVSSHEAGLLQYIIHTKIGDGPVELPESSHLLGADGLPLK